LNKAAVEPYAWGLGLDCKEYDNYYDRTAEINDITGLGYGRII
jgi:hypothetical protein